MLTQAIESTCKDESFWRVLVDESVAQSGPFDGGCLICAKALMLTVTDAELVRITSPLNGGQTEHYGVRVNGSIYDFDGIAHTEDKWIDRFRAVELVYDRDLDFGVGFDAKTGTPDDPEASKKISQIILKYM
jgi:hypothetical protein